MNTASPGSGPEAKRRRFRRRFWAGACAALAVYGAACLLFGKALLVERLLTVATVERWVSGAEARGAGLRYLCFAGALFLARDANAAVGRAAQVARLAGIALLVATGFATFLLF